MDKRIHSIRGPVLNEEDCILLTRDDKAWHVSLTTELLVEGDDGIRLFHLKQPILAATKTPSTVDTERRIARAAEVLKKRLEEEKADLEPAKVV